MWIPPATTKKKLTAQTQPPRQVFVCLWVFVCVSVCVCVCAWGGSYNYMFTKNTRCDLGLLLSPSCPDGMDREDSYPDQSCPMGNHRDPNTSSQWDDLCSSTSACSSDDEMKPVGHSKAELRCDTHDYRPAAVSLLGSGGPSAGLPGAMERGGQHYTGKRHAAPSLSLGHFTICTRTLHTLYTAAHGCLL